MFFLLPQGLLLYLLVPLAFFVVSDVRIKLGRLLKSYYLMFVFVIVLSLLTNILEPWLDLKSIFRACELIVVFYCFGKQKYLNISKWTIIALVIIIVVSQFSFLDSTLTRLIETYYPVKEEVHLNDNGDIDGIGSYHVRFGGLYREANDCAFYLNVLLLLTVVEIKQFGRFEFWGVVFVILLGNVLTGSRTGFAVILSSFILYFLNSKYKFKRLVPLIIVLLIALFYAGSMLSEFRLFQIGSGLNDSMSEKTAVFVDYLNKVSPLKYIFGCFGDNATKFITGSDYAGTDNDMGNILVTYGIFFYFILFGFFLNVYQKIKKEYRVLFAQLLWCVSGSLFLSYRTVALFMLLLGIYFRKSILYKKQVIV